MRRFGLILRNTTTRRLIRRVGLILSTTTTRRLIQRVGLVGAHQAVTGTFWIEALPKDVDLEHNNE
jgi:hypothetical protein